MAKTNREWLKDLVSNSTDEELANIVCKVIDPKKLCKYAYCNFVRNEEDDSYECDWNCKEGIQNWLQAEHKEE